MTQAPTVKELAQDVVNFVPTEDEPGRWDHRYVLPLARAVQALTTRLERATAEAAVLLDAANVALGHLTGGMDGDWREVDYLDLLRTAVHNHAPLATALLASIAEKDKRIAELDANQLPKGCVAVCPNGDCTREGADEWARCGNVECPLRAAKVLEG